MTGQRLAVRIVESGRAVVDELPFPVIESDGDAITGLSEALEACATFDRREAAKIILRPAGRDRPAGVEAA